VLTPRERALFYTNERMAAEARGFNNSEGLSAVNPSTGVHDEQFWVLEFEEP
jgi:hypothetical protein